MEVVGQQLSHLLGMGTGTAPEPARRVLGGVHNELRGHVARDDFRRRLALGHALLRRGAQPPPQVHAPHQEAEDGLAP
eukprot:4184521-Alexandrium_andersonii.AAC.1